MNSTSYFYNHSSQWRYEKLTAQELLAAGGRQSIYRTPDRFQRPRRAHGLAAFRAAAQRQPADH
jgi:nitrate reductase alpha subunit